MQADTSIAGSIAAMAQKFPAPPPPPPKAKTPGDAGDNGMNLLDFGDDEPAEAPADKAPDPLGLLDQLTAPAPPAQAPAAAGTDDWAEFTGADSSSKAAGASGQAAGGGDWAPFTGAGKGDDWNAFRAPAAPATSASANAAFADPFTVGGGGGAAQDAWNAIRAPAAPGAFAGASPSGGTGTRQALPLDAFATPHVEPIPVGVTGGAVSQNAAAGQGAPQPSPAADSGFTMGKLPEKDPFADLLG
jgi:hypothetical protein